jgi:hypothetical protein
LRISFYDENSLGLSSPGNASYELRVNSLALDYPTIARSYGQRGDLLRQIWSCGDGGID